MSDKPTAPHNLDLVMDFVNSLDLELGEEALSDPEALAVWLGERGLSAAGGSLSAADVSEAVSLREALRALMRAHNGGDSQTAAVERLDAVARRGRLSVHFADEEARLAPDADGVEGALAALLVPVAAAMSDGSWRRVKACRADGCHWAFYDFSRNRSGTWCDMAVCGNREKVRAYRGRSARSGGSSG